MMTTALAEQQRLQSMTRHGILIVQDECLLAGALQSLIADAGYHVVGVARDTAGADQLAMEHRPALAIVDMKLEIDVDGMATASYLKQKHGLEILITTGFPDSVTQREGVDAFACAIIRKPYSDEEILEALARCLSPSAAPPS
jgi:DNA-binding response OmpR family regulator